MLIYEPQGRALEYSFLALNHFAGCTHGCDYCYARKIAVQFGDDFEDVRIRDTFSFPRLEKEAIGLSGTKKRVLLSFMSDPYQPCEEQTATTRKVIKILKQFNIPFQILTKGGMKATRDFDLYGKHDAFASTLTFLNKEDSLKHEPRAAVPQNRIDAILAAHENKIETWVSLEPVIDVEQSLQLITETKDFVDLFKIGVLNHVACDNDWRSFGIKAIKLCEKYGKKYYVKTDLAKHLAGVKFTSTDTRMIKK